MASELRDGVIASYRLAPLSFFDFEIKWAHKGPPEWWTDVITSTGGDLSVEAPAAGKTFSWRAITDPPMFRVWSDGYTVELRDPIDWEPDDLGTA